LVRASACPGGSEYRLSLRLARVVDLEHAGRGLLLEPLARVPLVDLRRPGELGLRHALDAGEHLVEAEPIAEVDRHHVEGAEPRFEQPADERLRLRGGRVLARRARLLVGDRHPDLPFIPGRGIMRASTPVGESTMSVPAWEILDLARKRQAFR
jgi:hypothetical protein